MPSTNPVIYEALRNDVCSNHQLPSRRVLCAWRGQDKGEQQNYRRPEEFHAWHCATEASRLQQKIASRLIDWGQTSHGIPGIRHGRSQHAAFSQSVSDTRTSDTRSV